MRARRICGSSPKQLLKVETVNAVAAHGARDLQRSRDRTDARWTPIRSSRPPIVPSSWRALTLTSGVRRRAARRSRGGPAATLGHLRGRCAADPQPQRSGDDAASWRGVGGRPRYSGGEEAAHGQVQGGADTGGSSAAADLLAGPRGLCRHVRRVPHAVWRRRQSRSRPDRRRTPPRPRFAAREGHRSQLRAARRLALHDRQAEGRPHRRAASWTTARPRRSRSKTMADPITVALADIQSTELSTVSIMPEGLFESLQRRAAAQPRRVSDGQRSGAVARPLEDVELAPSRAARCSSLRQRRHRQSDSVTR